LSRRFRTIDLLLHADYPGVDDLFRNWSGLRAVYDGWGWKIPDLNHYGVLVPAIPPFAWPRLSPLYRRQPNTVRRPPDALFYRDEQAYYLDFAGQLGVSPDPPPYPFVPVLPTADHGIGISTLVLAPGCKTGEMAAKRWPWFTLLAEKFEDVAVVGTSDDLYSSALAFPPHVRSLIGRLSVAELAGVLANAGTVVANDSGIGHLAGAVGAPTLLIFGPTPDLTLGRLGPNVTVLRAGLACEPCWFSGRFSTCSGAITCLRALSPGRVAVGVSRYLSPTP
jgi:hypothetical protein